MVTGVLEAEGQAVPDPDQEISTWPSPDLTPALFDWLVPPL